MWQKIYRKSLIWIELLRSNLEGKGPPKSQENLEVGIQIVVPFPYLHKSPLHL